MTTTIHRISHSFPPDYSENNKYLANVHTIFENLKLDIDASKVYYRGIKNSSELKEIKLLHKEWFPPDYPQEFFDELFKNKAYRSIIAVYDTVYQKQKVSLILGCITYEFRGIDYKYVNFSLSDLLYERSSIYILTFGVINEARSKGIGSGLLHRLIEVAKGNSLVKYIFLDVVHYNDQAVRCYEKNGFEYLLTQHNFYDIFGKEYDALVFCFYLNGGRKPMNFSKMFLHRLNFPYHIWKALQGCAKRKGKIKQ